MISYLMNIIKYKLVKYMFDIVDIAKLVINIIITYDHILAFIIINKYTLFI